MSALMSAQERRIVSAGGDCRPVTWGFEPARGLEPLTFRLQVECATNCATPASPRRGAPEQGHSLPAPTLAPWRRER